MNNIEYNNAFVLYENTIDVYGFSNLLFIHFNEIIINEITGEGLSTANINFIISELKKEINYRCLSSFNNPSTHILIPFLLVINNVDDYEINIKNIIKSSINREEI